MGHRRVCAAALLMLAAATAGCTRVGTGGGGERHPYTHPHELRFSSAEDLVGLSTLSNSQATLGYLSAMTQAFLIRTDARGEPTVPELATEIPTKANGGISADGKVITFRLRRGVVWSDGAPFTADDVVFTTRVIRDPRTIVVTRQGWNLIQKIDEPDKYTVVYHLAKPYAPFIVTFFCTANPPAILPMHLLAGRDVNTASYNSLPVGIGPFKYQAWRRGDSVVMVANQRYFRGAPKLQRIIYREIQDRNTVLEELRTHELDLWMRLSPHFLAQVRPIAGVAVTMIPSYTVDHLDFNVQRPSLGDPVVRQALRLGVDRVALNQKINSNLYILNESVVPPVSRFHVDLPLVPFDIARANRLLDRDGWVRGADGIRAKAGARLSLDFATVTGTPDNDVRIELIRGWWKQLGIDLHVKHYLSAVFFATMQDGGIVDGGKFDVVTYGWNGDPIQDLSDIYACDAFPPNGQNDMRYCSKAVSSSLALAQTLYDPAERQPLMSLIQKQIDRDAPTVMLDTRQEMFAFNDDLKNWHPNAVVPFDDMLKVDI